MFVPNYIQTQSLAFIPSYGYTRTPTSRVSRLNALSFPSKINCSQKYKSTVLWPTLFKAFPRWCHGLQTTGDCVAWMFSHMADLTDAIRNIGNSRVTELFQTCSESIYAFGKCELKSNYSFHSPGMMGIDAILASEKFGRLLRKSYGSLSLSHYNGAIAVGWAEDPRKTHGVPDELEPEAAKHKMLCHLEATDSLTAAAFIEAGYPCGYCGDTRWGTRSDNQLQAIRFTNGAHAMALTGVRYAGQNPSHFWVANTGHGDHVEFDESPGLTPTRYKQCGTWMPTEMIDPVLRAGDCFVISADGLWNVHTLPAECTAETSFD